VPADAARAPLGATYTITGTGDAIISLMMSRVDETSPPGVSSRITSAAAFSCLAFWIACAIWRVVATPMTPFTSVTKTRLEDCALAGRATAAAMHRRAKPAKHLGQARHVDHAAIGPSD
jgi:hypothetical protein